MARKQDLARLEAVMDARFGAVDARFDAIDVRFDAIDVRFGAGESRLERLEDKVDELAREIRAQTWKLMTRMIAVVGVVVAAIRL